MRPDPVDTDPSTLPAGGRRRRWLFPATPLLAVVVATGSLGAYFGVRAAVQHLGGAGTSASVLGPRSQAAVAADPADGTVVMFGGVAPSGDLLDDTWTWTGGQWEQQHPAHRPPATSRTLMAYDPLTRADLLIPAVIPGTDDQHVWLWRDGDWHDTGAPAAPRPAGLRDLPGMVEDFAVGTDEALGRVILVDGTASPALGCPARTGGSGVYSCPMIPAHPAAATWMWSGSDWQERQFGGPPAFGPGVLGVDPHSHHAVFLPGGAAVTVCGRPLGPPPAGPRAAPALMCPLPAEPIPPVQPLSIWTGTTWRVDGSLPQNLWTPRAAALDPTSGKLLVAGVTDVATWDGSRWTTISGTLPESTTAGWVAMADQPGSRPLLIGELGGKSGTVHGATWSWTGAAWRLLDQTPTERVPGVQPVPAPATGSASAAPAIASGSAVPVTAYASPASAEPGPPVTSPCPSDPRLNPEVVCPVPVG